MCTDLDFYDREDLSEKFYGEYIRSMEFEGDPNARRLMNYYKSCRANVRAKVTLLHEKNAQDGFDHGAFSDVKKFIDLMDGYLDKIN